jgi:hypothetical protein
MIDEYGSSALDETGHAAGSRADLDDTLDDLNGAAVLVDDDRERCALDDRSQHRRVHSEMRDAGVLDLEQHGAEILDHPRETVRLYAGRKPQLTSRRDQNIVAAMDQRRPAGRPGDERVAGRDLRVYLERCGLEARMDNARVAAQLGDDPFVSLPARSEGR